MGAANCTKSAFHTKKSSKKAERDFESEYSSVSSLTAECAETPSLFSASALSVDVERVATPYEKVKEAMQGNTMKTQSLNTIDLCLENECPAKNMSSGKDMPDAETYARLKNFIRRSQLENRRHKSVLESRDKDVYIREFLNNENTKKDIECIDVFSPDERSSRWNEFIEFLVENKEGYEKFRMLTASVRGEDRAVTVGGVSPSNNPGTSVMGTLH